MYQLRQFGAKFNDVINSESHAQSTTYARPFLPIHFVVGTKIRSPCKDTTFDGMRLFITYIFREEY